MAIFFSRESKQRNKKKKSGKVRRRFERLEDRSLLAAYNVTNLNDSGAGSLRQAILDANATPGLDSIDFSIAGTITLTSGALPMVTDAVKIDGTTAPGYSAPNPVAQIDFNNFGGLNLNAQASGSVIEALSLVHAKADAITLNKTRYATISNDFIGLDMDGETADANQGIGVTLMNASNNEIEGNVISANQKSGISLSGSSGNTILGNKIGTDVGGTVDLGNGMNGIFLAAKSNSNTIGSNLNGNLISGNNNYGVLINSGSTLNTVSDNIIGLNAAASATLGNTLDGVKVQNASGNIIGQTNSVTGTTYNDANNGTAITSTVDGWQGIRAAATPGQYMMTGTSGNDGILFIGTLDGNTGTTYQVDVPGMYETSVYSPDLMSNGEIMLVGTYRVTSDSPVVHGFVFQGTSDDLNDPAHYTTIDYPGAQYTYVHSVANGLAVGNYDDVALQSQGGLPYGPSQAFIYNTSTGQFVTHVVYPGSKSNSVYTIWYNGGTSYTLAGGYSNGFASNFANQDSPIGSAFLVDYDSATGKFSHWTTFVDPSGKNLLTHFQGLSSVEAGVYTIAADSAEVGTGTPVAGSFVTVVRNADGSFGAATWYQLHYTGLDPTTNITSADSIYGDAVVGPVLGAGFNYQALVNIGFDLSNVISGNGGNGIELSGASNNQIAQNYIGTDFTGMIDLGNQGSGVVITNGSNGNMLGGTVSGGNDPTGGDIVMPALGNVISGNNIDGVQITGKATGNQLSGNFIGTDATGDAALGNTHDGVVIFQANGNSLIGCSFTESPFVYYNVISGNGGNGLWINNANNTTVQGNFFGLGANNSSAVGNGMNGVVVAGTSAHTTLGGPIPLGNVVSANVLNGLVLQDKASYFVSYNTFAGVAAFEDTPNSAYGNGEDGVLITSTGGHNLFRTCVISQNHLNGIHITGSAQGVDIVGIIAGLDWNGFTNMGNHRDGVLVDGSAHDIVIGGPQPTFNVIPLNAFSGNGWYGVDVEGNAHNVAINHSVIGTDVTGTHAIGNAYGVVIGGNTSHVSIGSTDSNLPTVISGNNASGVMIQSGHNDTIVGTKIGTDISGQHAMGNGAAGIYIVNSSNNMIGGKGADTGNIIANNNSQGVLVQQGTGNGILQNSIYGNGDGGILLNSGANNNQAAPVITSVRTTSQAVQIGGTLTSTPNKTFTLEFFASSTNDGSGQQYLGTTTVKTNKNGVGIFTFFGPVPSIVGTTYFTATATSVSNNTSEFSTAVT